MYDLDVFYKGLEELSLTFSEKQIQQFLKYYEMLLEKNKVMNLTAITEFQDVVIKHFLDSLSIVKIMDLKESHALIDIGTGAGFPGIPLKIAFPTLKVTLLDSLNKRIGFLNEVIEELGLTDIETIHGRAEDYGRDPAYREKYTLCVSRAVANLSSLSEYCLPFVEKCGYFVSYKSGKVDEEAKEAGKAVSILGGKIIDTHKFFLSMGEGERSFVVIEKVKNTPEKYPRKAGLPTRSPL